MHAQVDWVGARAFTAKGASGHEIRMDAAAEAGGQDTGARPTELVLMGLGGCTGIDVTMILEKMRIRVERLRIEVEGERAAEEPRRFTDIHVHYIVDAPDAPAHKVARAVFLSQERYCSVSHSLSAHLRASLTLNGGEVDVALGAAADEG
jgi:putative redox protein